MADTTPTPLAGSGTTTGSTPGYVGALTAAAMVLGTALTAFSGWLTMYATTHATAMWPPVALGISGVLLFLCSHWGYQKSTTVTTSTTVTALIEAARAGVPLAMDLLAQYLLKDPTATAAAPVTTPAPATTVTKPAAITTGGAASPPR